MNKKDRERLKELRDKYRDTVKPKFATGGVVKGSVSFVGQDGLPHAIRTATFTPLTASGTVDEEIPVTTWTSATTGPLTSGTTWTHTIPAIDPTFTRLPVTPRTVEYPRAIDAPAKSPKKVVVAFLDEDENVEWCAMVYPDSVDLQHHLREPSEMQISFKLIDANREAGE